MPKRTLDEILSQIEYQLMSTQEAKQEIAELLPDIKEVRADMGTGKRLEYYPNVEDCGYNQALKDVREALNIKE